MANLTASSNRASLWIPYGLEDAITLGSNPGRIRITVKGRKQMGEYIDIAKGRVKQAAGDLSDNQSLKDEGTVDILRGKVKGAFKNIRRVTRDVKQAVKNAGKKLT